MLKSIFYIILFLVIGELTVYLINMPIPGNVIGMLLIFTALSLKVIKLENVKPAADFLTRNLGWFFVPPGVGLMVYFSSIKENWVGIVTAIATPYILNLMIS